MARGLWAACLLSMLHVATAQQIAPANTTIVNSGNNGTEVAIFHGNSLQKRYTINPLQNSTSIPDGGLRGNITIAVPDTQLGVQSTDIAVLQCDPYGGNLSPSSVLSNILGRNPAAILLYSTNHDSCELSGSAGSYDRIYTMTSSDDSQDMIKTANANNASALIAPKDVVDNISTTETDNSNSGQSNGGSNGNNMTSWGPSPSTAVAMIILYSITGIITALFLVIIITGAIRAHRHPERYGPRNIIGRPRQSRARGLARAMLETLPIVRHGESQEEGRNKPADVELAEGHGPVEMVTGQQTAQNAIDGTRETGQGDAQNDAATTGGIAAATEHSDIAPEDNLGCSICTEDFAVGEDLRVLPCDHRYHPACIDPWLLNVSGTCPLCRIDLRPQATDEQLDEGGNAVPREDDAMAPPLNGEYHRSSIRRSLMIGLTGIGRPERLSREERVAAIRRYAEQQRAARAGEGGAVDPVEEESSMRRRLRNAFRVRTRRAGADGQVQEVADAPPTAATAAPESESESEVVRANNTDGSTSRVQS